MLIPPPLFSYLFLSSKLFTSICLAATFNFSSLFNDPITAPVFVSLFSATISPPFLAIKVV